MTDTLESRHCNRHERPEHDQNDNQLDQCEPCSGAI